MRKTNLTELTKLYLAASVTSAATGAVGGTLWQHLGGRVDFAVAIGGAWLTIVGVPSCLASAERLRRGLKAGRSTVTVQRGGLRRRVIPFSVNGRRSQLFMQQMRLGGQVTRGQVSFCATLDGISYTILLDELESFLYGVWQRQRSQHPYPLSRSYWTRRARPRIKKERYNGIMRVLCSVPGLVLDREKRRSGRLSGSPQYIMSVLKTVYQLV